MKTKTKVIVGIGAGAALLLWWRSRASSSMTASPAPPAVLNAINKGFNAGQQIIKLAGDYEAEAGFRRYR